MCLQLVSKLTIFITIDEVILYDTMVKQFEII
jgi:hypothetical protein